MRRSPRVPAIRIVAVLAAATLAAAVAPAMTITTAAGPPSGPFLLALDPGTVEGSYDCDHGSSMATDVGQTFRLSQAATLDRLTLRVRPETDVAGELVTLSFGTFSGAADAEMNELLSAEVRALPDDLEIGDTVYLTLDVEDLELAAGQQYGFLLGFSGGGYVNDAQLDVLHTGEDAYPAGQAIGSGGSWPSALGDDLVLYLQGTGDDLPPPDGDPLVLQGGRFTVEVGWATASASGDGTPVGLTDESGWFWFFSPENVELLVKVLDGCSEPQHTYWVFMAGLTDVAVTVRVTDTAAGFEHTWTTPAGEPFPATLDTWTFDTCSD